ncbi:gamma-tubulin complex component 6-like [Clavelina lepadiformis]|uniref:gamma-tubulin complex component 6-like n=1 Tax=Clavelina lepadiformis TaxID=159417 RepID=UPI0040433A17
MASDVERELKHKKMSNVVETSLPVCITSLANINLPQTRAILILAKENVNRRNMEKHFKLIFYNALFSRKLLKMHKSECLSWKLLSDYSWSNSLTCRAVTFRMRLKQRKYLQADQLELLTDQILAVENGRYEPVVKLLLCLAESEKMSHAKCQHLSPVNNFKRSTRNKVLSMETALQHGDVPGFLFNKLYRSFPKRTFFLDNDKYFFPWGEGLPSDLCFSSLNYRMPNPKCLGLGSNYKSFHYESKEELHGLFSDVSHLRGSVCEEMSTYSKETLYGALSHSRVSSVNIKLSLPNLPHSDKLDLCAALRKNQLYDEDEGFVSPGTTPSPQSETSGNSSEDDSGINLNAKFFDDNEPYSGYRVPRHDLSNWDKCLDVKRSYHRTWETIGMLPGSSKQKWYLTEAGAVVYDFIWQKRLEIIIELANALSKQSKLPDIVKSHECPWIEVDEATLVQHSQFVTVGIASETFCFNKLAQMYLSVKNIYISGVTVTSTRSLLSTFAEWGTCYRRLLQFSVAGTYSHEHGNDMYAQTQGVIFKAFCDGIRHYLQCYHRSLLLHNKENTTLQQLAVTFRNAGCQIRYLCHLCKCGDPLDAASTSSVDFPTGIELLTYLYEEAIHCMESNSYLVLLYLLRKCCQPYLHFVQNWVFYGNCWDITGEFMLRINAANGSRRDRQRWSNYVVASKPDLVSCVPSFLSYVAEDMFICGKTIEFFQLVCPEHFLCTHPILAPDLLITYSTSRMQELSQKWYSFEASMRQIEHERSVSWKLKEEKIERTKKELVITSQTIFEQQLQDAQLAMKHVQDQVKEGKKIELKRLKDQAEEAIERRKFQRIQEKEADKVWQDNVLNREKKEVEHEKKLVQEAKDEMIAHYEMLSQKAEKRKEKANWRTKRHMLHDKRVAFFRKEQEEAVMNVPHGKLVPLGIHEVVKSEMDAVITTANNSNVLVPSNSIEKTRRRIDNNLEIHPDLDKTSFIENEVNVQTKSTLVTAELSHVPESTQPLDSITLKMYDRKTTVMSFTGHNIFEESTNGRDLDRKCERKTHGSISQSKVDMRNTLNSLPIEKQCHVSDESTKNSQYKSSTVLVDGKHVSHSTVFSTSSPPSGELIHNKPVDGKHVSQSTVFSTSSPIAGELLYGKTIDGKHVSQSTVFSTSTAPSDKLICSRTVDGKHVSQSTVFSTSSPPSGELLHGKIIDGKHVSQSTVFSTSSPPSGELIHNKPVDGKHVSQSTVFSTSSPPSGELIHNKPVDGKHVSQSTVVSTSSAPSDKLICSRTVDGKHVSQSTVFSTSTAPSDKLICSRTVDGKHVSDSAINLAMQADYNKTFHKPMRKKVENCNILDSPVAYILNEKGNFFEHLETRSPDQSTQLPGQDVTHAYPKVLLSNSAAEIPAYTSVARDQNKILVVEQKHKEDTTLLPSLPVQGIYDKTIPDLEKHLACNRDISDPLKLVDLYTAVVDHGANMLEDEDYDVIGNIPGQDNIVSFELHALPVLLRNCVVGPILSQAALVNRCAVNYFMTDLALPRHFEMLRSFVLLEDGEFSQTLTNELFGKVHCGCRPSEILNPVSLRAVMSNSIQSSSHKFSPHISNLSFVVKFLPPAFSATDLDVLSCLQMRYQVDWPLNIILTESCHNKYNTVLSFFLQLKHVVWALHDIRARLARIDNGQSAIIRVTSSEVRMMHLYRHEMHNFVKVMQGYVSTQVLHVCWKEFHEELNANVSTLDDLHLRHAEYINKCVLRCLLTPKAQNVMNVIGDILKCILQFRAQLAAAESVSFHNLQRTYRQFSQYSSFLYRVVLRLVQRGYQPHLEDFLVRLNFNGFYKS